jgi:hypothetical protein
VEAPPSLERLRHKSALFDFSLASHEFISSISVANVTDCSARRPSLGLPGSVSQDPANLLMLSLHRNDIDFVKSDTFLR